MKGAYFNEMVLFIVKLFMQARRKEKLQKMWHELNERSPGSGLCDRNVPFH